jgi:pyruvate formate lyase activating enzyme
VVKDVSYYQNTGGGVTLSGGEPLLQPEFAVEILKKCKDLGINTALETCGQVPWRVLEEALAYTDFVLYDIKQMDAAKHKSGTGSSNELILENARKVAALKPMRVRVPLIPGFNSFREDVEAIARFVKTELPSVAIDLLAYNKMGESKYARLGREPVSLTMQDESLIQELKKIAASLS